MAPGPQRESSVDAAVAAVRARVPRASPRVGVVLGSGLGGFVEQVADAETLDYADLPGFPEPGVAGHAGRLVLGRVGATPVAVLQGRAHTYETGRCDAMKTPIRCLARLGCEILVLTNAAGSLTEAAPPGGVMLIADHINLVGMSPLFGEAGDERFVDMTGAYDEGLRNRIRAVAEREEIGLAEGVYMWFAGPNFETPAEVRSARILGADAVGMSTVPEVILARHAGLRVAALSIITNQAAGLGGAALSHAQTLRVAAAAAERVQRLLAAFLAGLQEETA